MVTGQPKTEQNLSWKFGMAFHLAYSMKMVLISLWDIFGYHAPSCYIFYIAAKALLHAQMLTIRALLMNCEPYFEHQVNVLSPSHQKVEQGQKNSELPNSKF